MPGYQVDFAKSKIEEQLLCPKCSFVLKSPYQSFCGHRYCFSCIEEIKRPDSTFVCVVDGEVNKDVFPDRFVQRQINTTKVGCKNTPRGCTWFDVVKEYEFHLDVCEYDESRCPNVFNGCKEILTKESREKHIKSCKFREVTCDYCKEKMLYANLRNHLQNHCSQAKSKCRHCNKDVVRSKLEVHKMHECEEYTTKCPFTAIGCGAVRPMKKQEKKKHSENALIAHVMYLLQVLLEIKNVLFKDTGEPLKVKSSKARSQAVAGSSNNAEDTGLLAMHDRVSEIENWIKCFLKEKKGTDGGKGRFDKWDEPLEKPDSMAGGAQGHESGYFKNDKMASQYGEKSLVQQVAVINCNHEEVIKSLYAENARLTQKCADLEKMVTECSDYSAAVRQKFIEYDSAFENMEKTMVTRDTTMVELGDRISATEAVNYSGRMIFAIHDFDVHRKNAILGRVTSIYSLPFYTSRYGYRMRLRVYLNGDGMGKGSHISLYIVIERNHYDALLSWPFNQRVTFTIVDQIGGNDIVDAFRPDPASSSFHRPKRERNIASGCPLFMPLTLLESGGYTKDNVMFVRTVVDTSGLDNF